MLLILVSQLLGHSNKNHNRFQIICLFVTNCFSTGTLDIDCSADANVCAGDGEVCDTGNTDVCICDVGVEFLCRCVVCTVYDLLIYFSPISIIDV